ncbi:MAG: DNA alkylation repair protein, partial [Coriobacteriia bacterium]|nr:DNA alkylation repair protein [Coriobacteriia bacterium]
MQIFETFIAAANPEKAVQMSAYMRDQFAFLGIPKPERAKLSKEFIKQASKQPIDWDFIHECWQQQEREFQYLACDYLGKYKRTLVAADLHRLEHLIVTKSWWDTVDSLDALVGEIAQRHPETVATLLAWSTDDNIWLRRSAINHQLAYKDKTDTDLLATILTNNFGQQEFFINKAIGWSLR